jgi:hypothetical protein
MASTIWAFPEMTGIDAIGYLAAGLVVATFCMRSMRGLRCVAIASNLAFISYGYVGDLMPVLMLHLILLPVNMIRLSEHRSAQRRVAEKRISMRRSCQSARESAGVHDYRRAIRGRASPRYLVRRSLSHRRETPTRAT